MAGHGTAARSRGKERHVGVPCGVRNSKIGTFEVVSTLQIWNRFNLHLGIFRPTSQGVILLFCVSFPKLINNRTELKSHLFILSIGQFLKPNFGTPWKPRPNSEMSAAAVNAYANQLAWEEAWTVPVIAALLVL